MSAPQNLLSLKCSAPFLKEKKVTFFGVWLLFPGLGVGKQKLIGKSSSRKSKSPIPGQGYLGTERPSSVSSVHSEGDYHRQTPVWAWEDRPSSTGEEQCQKH